MTDDETKCTKDPRTCGFWLECEEYVSYDPERTRKVMKCTAADIPMLIVEGRQAWICPFIKAKGESK